MHSKHRAKRKIHAKHASATRHIPSAARHLHHVARHIVHHNKHVSSERELLEKYKLEVDGAGVEVFITRDQLGTKYNLKIPEISPATGALLNGVRNELVYMITISMKELTDPEAFYSIKKRFMTEALRILKSKLPNIDKDVEKFFIGIIGY